MAYQQESMAELGERIRSTQLLNLDGCDWCVRDAIEGTQIFGATGSGKTSGSGGALARAFLDPKNSYGGFGGLVLTCKGDERHDWEKWMQDVGRDAGDLLSFSPGADKQFNFLAYEATRGGCHGGLSQNLVSLFLAAMSGVGGDGASVSRADPFWDDTLRELLTHAVDLAILRSAPGDEPLSLELLLDIVRSAPSSRDEARSHD